MKVYGNYNTLFPFLRSGRLNLTSLTLIKILVFPKKLEKLLQACFKFAQRQALST